MSTTPSSAAVRVLLSLTLVASFAASLGAQTIDDGIMMGKHDLFTGNIYSHESWEEYWEGALKRTNGNIGTVTTQTNSWFANYGLTDRFNIIANVPYVWTHANQGVLHGMNGMQDVTIAGKFQMFDRPSPVGVVRAIAVVTAGLPMTDYLADFQPLSIGNQSKKFGGRFTLNMQTEPGFYINGSMAYTIRSQVKLDRPYYFTDGQFFMTDVVEMPEMFDYLVGIGYLKNGLNAMVSIMQQRTLGGGDIRRQDAPFISNRMNFAKLGGMLMVPVPKLHDLTPEVSLAHVFDGRNVGQSTTVTVGVLYRFNFFGRATP